MHLCTAATHRLYFYLLEVCIQRHPCHDIVASKTEVEICGYICVHFIYLLNCLCCAITHTRQTSWSACAYYPTVLLLALCAIGMCCCWLAHMLLSLLSLQLMRYVDADHADDHLAVDHAVVGHYLLHVCTRDTHFYAVVQHWCTHCGNSANTPTILHYDLL
jgi:hypothetical protein